MALSHLLDTSVIKRLGVPEIRAVVEPLALAGEAARTTVSDLEIGFSARTEAEWDALIEALDGFPVISTSAGHVRRALQVQRLLAARSQRGRKLPDLLIAATAEDLGLTVLHYDRDFDLIAAVTGQRCRLVVPAGSID